MSAATFPLVPRRRVVGLPFGGLRSARRGPGSDVASSRPYRPGDNVDAIDWAASARLSAARGTDEFIVREHYAEESPRVVVLPDRRPSLAVGPPPRGRLRKAEAMDVALALISSSAASARSLVGYLDYAEGDLFWRPPRSEHQEPPRGDRPFEAPEESFAEAFAYLAQQRRDLPPGSFVFVLSDFLAPPSRAAWLQLVEHRWDVVPVVIQDPVWERSFPDTSGLVVPFAEPQSGRAVLVRLGAREATALREANEGRWSQLLADLRSVGLDPVVLDSQESAEIASTFLRWADERIYVRGRA